jgi:hypothetical protein
MWKRWSLNGLPIFRYNSKQCGICESRWQLRFCGLSWRGPVMMNYRLTY